MLGGLSADVKVALTRVFDYVLPNGRFGPVEHQTKAESFQNYHVVSTTGTSTGEFSVLHGMGRTPYRATPQVGLDSTGYAFPVLRVSRVADAQRIYFRPEAGSTNMIFSLLIE